MDSNEALHELARRARVERSLHIAEAISDAIFAVHRFVGNLFVGPDAHRATRRVRQSPVHQR
jgi:hypothetical protein